MAFDFPTSPANGDVSNGYTYSTAAGAWLGGPGMAGPQTEQFFDISGVASPPGAIVQVPSWAKACQIELHVFVGAGASNNLLMRYSVDGTTFIAGAADYAVGGPHHAALGGTPFSTSAAVTYHSVYLAFANDPNVTSPHQVSGTIALTRPDTSKQLGNVRMQSRNWDNNASAGLRTNWMTGYLVPASPGSALAIKALQFFSALGNAFGAGSWLRVKWLGDSAQIPQSNAIEEAPQDGARYYRQNGIWVKDTSLRTLQKRILATSSTFTRTVTTEGILSDAHIFYPLSATSSVFCQCYCYCRLIGAGLAVDDQNGVLAIKSWDGGAYVSMGSFQIGDVNRVQVAGSVVIYVNQVFPNLDVSLRRMGAGPSAIYQRLYGNPNYANLTLETYNWYTSWEEFE